MAPAVGVGETSILDALHRIVLDLIKEEANRRLVIMVTHKIEDIEALSSVATVIELKKQNN